MRGHPPSILGKLDLRIQHGYFVSDRGGGAGCGYVMDRKPLAIAVGSEAPERVPSEVGVQLVYESIDCSD